MKMLFVHEFVAGGGLAGAAQPTGLLSQGLSMLRALLDDLAGVAGRRVVTTVDARLSLEFPREIDVVPVTPGSHGAIFQDLAGAARDVWIVAPETGGCLADLTEHATALGARPVGAEPDAVRLASDKLLLCQHLAEAGLPVPTTWPSAEVMTAVRELGFPLVAKPALGAGCEGVGLARNWAELDDVLRRAREIGGTAIVQEYIEGTAASASILCAGGRARALSLNGQDVHADRSFSYTGGHVPLRHSQADEALAVACQACELIPGLAGYVGVDLILSDRGPLVVEINPRLTTAYVGLRAATAVNIAEMIFEVVERGHLPDGFKVQGMVQFTASGNVETSEQ